MASEIDQNKLKVAIDWINKLANGMNPLDGSNLPDGDIDTLQPFGILTFEITFKLLLKFLYFL